MGSVDARAGETAITVTEPINEPKYSLLLDYESASIVLFYF